MWAPQPGAGDHLRQLWLPPTPTPAAEEMTDGEFLPGDPWPAGPVPPEPPAQEWRDAMHTRTLSEDLESAYVNTVKAAYDAYWQADDQDTRHAAADRLRALGAHVNAPNGGQPLPATMPVNPKQLYGDAKVPLHLFPSTAVVLGAMAFLEGRQKYGNDNFRAAPIEAMTYVRAALSHINLYQEGEWKPGDSHVPHLGLALASIAILIDAHYAGSLIDNRHFPGGYLKAIAEMQPFVQQIRDQHADKDPKHYTIADASTTTVVSPRIPERF